MKNPVYTFSGLVKTDNGGINKIASFYNFCLNYENCQITVLFDKINFFDANISAILLGLSFKLTKERGITFSTDESIFENSSLGVLKRNGLAYYLFNLDGEIQDERKSVIPIRLFNIIDADGFANYIESDLFTHRGLTRVCKTQLEKLKSSYFEIFDNVGIHSGTDYPVFACGQFYPQLRELKFTLVDLGNGFLKNIKEYTINTPNPVVDIENAIKWAILGGSTKQDAQGGTGLGKILTYCINNQGAMHIYSDGCYWMYDGKLEITKTEFPLCGATISLVFRNL